MICIIGLNYAVQWRFGIKKIVALVSMLNLAVAPMKAMAAHEYSLYNGWVAIGTNDVFNINL